MVAEHGCPRNRGVWPPQEQILEKICEQIADVYVPQVVEQIIEVHKMAEQILDVLVLEMVEHLVEVPKTVLLDRTQQRTVEQIVDARVPQVVEELAEVFRVFSQGGIQQRIVEQTIPAFPLAEKIVELLVIQTEGTTQRGVNTHAQHVVNAVEVEKSEIIEETGQKPIIQEKIDQVTKHVEIPQFTDKVVDIPVVAQRQISTVQTVQTRKAIPQLHDEVIDVPAVFVVLVPQVHDEMKTVETTQLQPVEQVPHVHVVKKTVEDAQLQVVEKIGEIPEDFPVCIPRETLQQNKILCVVKKTLVKSRLEMLAEIECDEGHEFMLQGNDSVSVAKDVVDEANEVSEMSPDCMVCSSESGSTRQQHKQRATTQTAQEERERGKKGPVGKRPGREKEGRKGS